MCEKVVVVVVVCVCVCVCVWQISRSKQNQPMEMVLRHATGRLSGTNNSYSKSSN